MAVLPYVCPLWKKINQSIPVTVDEREFCGLGLIHVRRCHPKERVDASPLGGRATFIKGRATPIESEVAAGFRARSNTSASTIVTTINYVIAGTCVSVSTAAATVSFPTSVSTAAAAGA